MGGWVAQLTSPEKTLAASSAFIGPADSLVWITLMLESGFRSAARATAPSIFFACSALYTTTRQLSSEAFGCGPSVSGTAAVPANANANANVNANVDANACWHHQDGVRYIWRCHWGVTFLNYTSPLPPPPSLSLSTPPSLPLSLSPPSHKTAPCC